MGAWFLACVDAISQVGDLRDLNDMFAMMLGLAAVRNAMLMCTDRKSGANWPATRHDEVGAKLTPVHDKRHDG